MAIQVPSQYVSLLKSAAQETGLPYNVVAAQVQTESTFDPHATSPAGAEGLFQFEPSTYGAYGGKPGTEYDPTIEKVAYVNLMKALLKQYNGSVRNALAAYNAGTASSGAGQSYASTILSLAGEGNITVKGTGSGPASTSTSTSTSANANATTTADWWGQAGEFSPLNPISSAGSILKDISGTASGIGDVAVAIKGLAVSIGTITHWLSWVFAPANWVRVGAFVAGAILLISGLIILINAANPSIGQNVKRGIEDTAGAAAVVAAA